MNSELILFDIDGTLLRRAGPHHREVLVDAVKRITGMETTTEGVPVHGMLDGDILAAMMRNAGAERSRISESLPEIMHLAQTLYVRRCPDLRDKTCPGVRRLLYMLRRRGAVMALVTGNLTKIGWKKMEKAGLRDNFALGAFADMAPTRSDLAATAIRDAKQRGLVNGQAKIALIGDAPSDILAARANGVRSIAVHTGVSTREELQVHAPDLLLKDLLGLNARNLFPG